MVAHHRQIRSARHAHPHDRGDLRNPQRAHYRVVSEDAPKIIRIRENIFLEGQENSRGIHQINRGNPILHGDVLGANHLLCGHREKRAGFHSRIIGNEHERASAHFRQSGDGASARCATPFFIHFVRGIDSQFKKARTRIDQLGDALAGGQAALFVLRFDGLCAATHANLFFLVLDGGKQIDGAAGVLFEFWRLTIGTGFQDRI